VKYIDEFRKENPVHRLSEEIHKRCQGKKMTFMEVCGTHTMSIARYGIRELLPKTIELISGPGCPVCVTPNRIIDTAVSLARVKDVIIATFGDMMKVPGSSSSLENERSQGRDVRVVTSTMEALSIASRNPDKKIIFIGVGFETTAPTIAASVLEAREKNLSNYYIVCAHKLIPPAMETLSRGEVNIDGYICPGHVSAVIGSEPYRFLAEKYGIGCVVSGFEPSDILQSILMLVNQIVNEEAKVEIQYKRVVKPEGNRAAYEIMMSVLEPCDSDWRGIGMIPDSGLKLRDEFSDMDAVEQIPVDIEPLREQKGCICGKILQGMAKPFDCVHFGKSCTPENPIGPCMVSSEGTCAAYYKYQRR